MGRAGIDPDPALIDLRFQIDAGIDGIWKPNHWNEKLLLFKEEWQRFQSPGSETGRYRIVVPEPEAWRAGHGARKVARAGFAITEEVGVGHPLLGGQGQLVNGPIDQRREQCERAKAQPKNNQTALMMHVKAQAASRDKLSDRQRRAPEDQPGVRIHTRCNAR